jgi:hypothetical protein
MKSKLVIYITAFALLFSFSVHSQDLRLSSYQKDVVKNRNFGLALSAISLPVSAFAISSDNTQILDFGAIVFAYGSYFNIESAYQERKRIKSGDLVLSPHDSRSRTVKQVAGIIGFVGGGVATGLLLSENRENEAFLALTTSVLSFNLALHNWNRKPLRGGALD